MAAAVLSQRSPFHKTDAHFQSTREEKSVVEEEGLSIMIWENQDIYRLSFSTAAVHNTLRALTSGEI